MPVASRARPRRSPRCLATTATAQRHSANGTTRRRPKPRPWDHSRYGRPGRASGSTISTASLPAPTIPCRGTCIMQLLLFSEHIGGTRSTLGARLDAAPSLHGVSFRLSLWHRTRCRRHIGSGRPYISKLPRQNCGAIARTSKAAPAETNNSLMAFRSIT